MKTIKIISAVILFLGLNIVSTAQEYTTLAEVISSGGGAVAGGSYSNFGVLGEPLSGDSLSGGNYYNSIGFLYTSNLITGITELIEEGNFAIFPNPLQSTATIKYNVSRESLVSVEIFNICGKKIQTLVNEVQSRGEHSFAFNTDKLKPGVYLCTIKTTEGVQTKKLIKLE